MNHPEEASNIELNVNDKLHPINVAPFTRLLDVLRDKLRLTGTKEGCGEGECGACAVIIDGKVINSCLIPIATVKNSKITTIEGLSGKAAELVKESFALCNGAQCGICTPGMVISATDLLNKNPNPELDVIKESLSGNLCRCTGYIRIIHAVDDAARKLKES